VPFLKLSRVLMLASLIPGLRLMFNHQALDDVEDGLLIFRRQLTDGFEVKAKVLWWTTFGGIED